MDKKKILEALKLIKDAFVTTPQTFKDAKLEDGVTIITYEGDKLDVGVAVMAVTEQGKLPLPDGDYVLEDGTKFNIAAGVVTAVTPVEEAPVGEEKPSAPGAGAPQAGAQMTEGQAKTIVESVIRESRFAEDIADLKKEIEGFKTQKETFATQKAEDNKTIDALKLEVKESKELMLKAIEVIEKVADEPSDKPAEGKVKEKFDVKTWRSEFKKDIANLKPADKTN